MGSIVSGTVDKTKGEEIAESLNQAHDAIVREPDANRFLLGEELYKSSIELTNLIYNKLNLLAANDADKLKKQIKKLKQYVQTYKAVCQIFIKANKTLHTDKLLATLLIYL